MLSTKNVNKYSYIFSINKIVTLCYNFGEILEVILWQSYTLDLVQWEAVKQ